MICVRRLVAARVPAAVAPHRGNAGRTGWRHGCPAGARLSSSVEGISISTIGSRRPALGPRAEIGAVHIAERRRDDDAGGEMVAGLGQAGEARQLGQRDVHPEGRGFARPVAPCARADLGGDRAFGQQVGRTAAWVDARGHRLGAVGLAAGDGAGRAALLDDHLLDRRVEDDLDALLARRLGHRLGDRAHAADRMAPGARDARRLAEDMVEQDIGRARRIGAGIMADDGVEAEQGLDEIVAEIAVEDVGGRLGEEIDAGGAAPRGSAGRRRRRA